MVSECPPKVKIDNCEDQLFGGNKVGNRVNPLFVKCDGNLLRECSICQVDVIADGSRKTWSVNEKNELRQLVPKVLYILVQEQDTVQEIDGGGACRIHVTISKLAGWKDEVQGKQELLQVDHIQQKGQI